MELTDGEHQFIVATHIDCSHTHNHLIINSTALDYERKFRNFWKSAEAVAKISDRLCEEYKLSIVENPQGKAESYDELQEIKYKNSNYRSYLKDDIDRIILFSDYFEDFLS
jgi:type IV secretory pathway VirD2 relaxase